MNQHETVHNALMLQSINIPRQFYFYWAASIIMFLKPFVGWTSFELYSQRQSAATEQTNLLANMQLDKKMTVQARMWLDKHWPPTTHQCCKWLTIYSSWAEAEPSSVLQWFKKKPLILKIKAATRSVHSSWFWRPPVIRNLIWPLHAIILNRVKETKFVNFVCLSTPDLSQSNQLTALRIT